MRKPDLPEWQVRAANSKVGKKRPAQAEVMRRLHKEGKLKQTAEQRVPALARLHDRTRKSHPRGMLGKRHSEATRIHLSITRQGEKRNLSALARRTLSEKASKMMRERLVLKGTIYSRSTQGWYEIAGTKYYFRSTWEVVYARYLQWLLNKGDIKNWEYEADTFWFAKIRRGVMSYLPDFKVTENNGAISYHEVKGWMDAKSKTKIARMAKYYPSVLLVVIGKAEYTAVKQWERLYPEAKHLQ